jgi:hypothetical protein
MAETTAARRAILAQKRIRKLERQLDEARRQRGQACAELIAGGSSLRTIGVALDLSPMRVKAAAEAARNT